MKNIIQVESLTKTFNLGKPSELSPVKEVSFGIEEGSCVLLNGASGSGKTTLLSILGCLSKPTSGRYWCCGEAVGRWSEKFLTNFRKAHIGIVFQGFHLIDGLTAAENIALPLLPEGLSARELRKKVEQAAQTVNITHRLTFDVNHLSGGELQRVAIARALVANPTILLADEPTAHLDSENAAMTLALFASLKSQGKTILLTSHDAAVAAHPMIDKILTMKDGNLSHN